MLDLIVLLFIGLSPGFFFTLPVGSRLRVAIAHGILFAALIGFLTFHLYEGFQNTPEMLQGSSLQAGSGTVVVMPKDVQFNFCVKNFVCGDGISPEDCERIGNAVCMNTVKNPMGVSDTHVKIADTLIQDKTKGEP